MELLTKTCYYLSFWPFGATNRGVLLLATLRYLKNGEYENDVLQTIPNHKSLIKMHLCAVDWAATRVKTE